LKGCGFSRAARVSKGLTAWLEGMPFQNIHALQKMLCGMLGFSFSKSEVCDV